MNSKNETLKKLALDKETIKAITVKSSIQAGGNFTFLRCQPPPHNTLM